MHFLKHGWPSLFFVCLGGCTGELPSYPPPIQRQFSLGNEPKVVTNAFLISSPGADRHILGGVLGGDPGASWRWANPKVDLRFQISENKSLRFFMDYVIAEATFKVTGPGSVKFSVNGQAIGSQRFAAQGEKHFEAAVPDGLIKPGEITMVTAECDNPWTSPDGTKLAFLLVGAGFKE